MAITIEEREHRGTAVLVVTGRIALTECHGDLENAVELPRSARTQPVNTR